MAVNITNISNIDSVNDLGQYAADATSGLFWGLILMGIFVIVVYNLRERGVDNAVMAASFSCFIISIFLLNLGWVQLIFPIAFGIFLGGSAFYKYYNRNNQTPY